MHELSSEKMFFLDTEVFKDLDLPIAKSMMFKHIIGQRKRSYIHNSLHATSQC